MHDATQELTGDMGERQDCLKAHKLSAVVIAFGVGHVTPLQVCQSAVYEFALGVQVLGSVHMRLQSCAAACPSKSTCPVPEALILLCRNGHNRDSLESALLDLTLSTSVHRL